MGKYCQFDEEEKITEIFEKIGTTNRFAVEFGCHPDNRLSNTAFLRDQGWTVQQYSDETGGYLIKERITAENINDVFRKYEVPPVIDLMSIDIDGMDYHVWKALEAVSPRLVIIEHNYRKKKAEDIPIYDKDNHWNGVSIHFGSSQEALTGLGESKGYVLVHSNIANLFFVKEELWGDSSKKKSTKK